jgi:hypothetical protein
MKGVIARQSSYRPITETSVVCKQLEHVIAGYFCGYQNFQNNPRCREALADHHKARSLFKQCVSLLNKWASATLLRVSCKHVVFKSSAPQELTSSFIPYSGTDITWRD